MDAEVNLEETLASLLQERFEADYKSAIELLPRILSEYLLRPAPFEPAASARRSELLLKLRPLIEALERLPRLLALEYQLDDVPKMFNNDRSALASNAP